MKDKAWIISVDTGEEEMSLEEEFFEENIVEVGGPKLLLKF